MPAFSFGQTTAPRYTDMPVRPLGLGGRAKRADVTAGGALEEVDEQVQQLRGQIERVGLRQTR